MIAAHMIGPRRDTTVKLMAYESGMDPIGDARQRFDVKFYLIAILFLVFDVELLFLYPVGGGRLSRASRCLPGELQPDRLRGSAGLPRHRWSWPTSTPGGRGCSDGGRPSGKRCC